MVRTRQNILSAAMYSAEARHVGISPERIYFEDINADCLAEHVGSY
jgi:hypothetical protein